jgi:hypothetical protein
MATAVARTRSDVTSAFESIPALDVLATGKWRDVPGAVERLQDLLAKTGNPFNVTRFPQGKEGSNQALFLFNALVNAKLVSPGVTLFIAGGRGSVQATPIVWSEGKATVLAQATSSGFPKEGVIVTDDKTAMLKDLKERFPELALIVLTDSFFHRLKAVAPVVKDKDPLPTSVDHNGAEFKEQFEFVAELYPDTPTLSLRNFLLPDGRLCKGTFVVSDKATVDLGTGKARLVDPTTGAAVNDAEFDLPADWMTNDDSLAQVAGILSELHTSFERWVAYESLRLDPDWV